MPGSLICGGGQIVWLRLDPESLAAPLARLARPRWTPGPLPPCARGACSGLQGAARALTDSTPAPPSAPGSGVPRCAARAACSAAVDARAASALRTRCVLRAPRRGPGAHRFDAGSAFGAWIRSPSLRRSRGLLGRGGRQGRFRPAHAVRAPGSKARPGRSPIRRRLRLRRLEPESLAAPLARLARPRWTPGPLPPCARGACSGLQGAARALTDSTPVPPKEKAPCGALFFWCLEPESNQRHMDFQSIALPTELPRRELLD